MKSLLPLGIAAGLAAVVAVITSFVPSLTPPAFASYVVAVLIVTICYDYTRGHAWHRYF